MFLARNLKAKDAHNWVIAKKHNIINMIGKQEK